MRFVEVYRAFENKIEELIHEEDSYGLRELKGLVELFISIFSNDIGTKDLGYYWYPMIDTIDSLVREFEYMEE